MKRLGLLFCAFLLFGCASRQQAQPGDCSQIYTILPGNYIIDLAAGARIELDPAVQEFVLFCSPEDAKKALKNAVLPGDWRIYKIEGTLAEVGEGSGEYKLKCPALIEDWVEN